MLNPPTPCMFVFTLVNHSDNKKKTLRFSECKIVATF